MPPLSDLTTENDSDGYGYVFGIGFVLGMFFSVFVMWMKNNLEFAKRPSIVTKNQTLDTYEMLNQRPMPLPVAAGAHPSQPTSPGRPGRFRLEGQVAEPCP